MNKELADTNMTYLRELGSTFRVRHHPIRSIKHNRRLRINEICYVNGIAFVSCNENDGRTPCPVMLKMDEFLTY